MRLIRSFSVLLFSLQAAGCWALPTRPWPVPCEVYDRIVEGSTRVDEVDRLLGVPEWIEFTGLDSEARVYTFDAFESDLADPAFDDKQQDVRLTVELQHDVVTRKSTARSAGSPYARGKPKGFKGTDWPKTRTKWHALLARQLGDPAKLEKGSGLWALETPTPRDARNAWFGAGSEKWIIVRQGDELYLEPTRWSPRSKHVCRLLAKGSSAVGAREWTLACEPGNDLFSPCWDVDLEFDPGFTMVQATWHEPILSQGNGFILDVIAGAIDIASSEPTQTGGRLVVWPSESGVPVEAAQPR